MQNSYDWRWQWKLHSKSTTREHHTYGYLRREKQQKKNIESFHRFFLLRKSIMYTQRTWAHWLKIPVWNISLKCRMLHKYVRHVFIRASDLLFHYIRSPKKKARTWNIHVAWLRIYLPWKIRIIVTPYLQCARMYTRALLFFHARILK